MNDSATLSGGFNPTGTITFNLYDPDQPTCSGTPRFTQVVTVTGNGTYSTTGGFPADKAGTWNWTASYSGDTRNATASSNCGAEPVQISPTNAKMTGGGEIFTNGPANSGQKASFGLIAQTKNGAATGHFNYVNHVTGLHVNGPVDSITEVNPTTHTMTFSGTSTQDGCRFTVRVQDNGEPGGSNSTNPDRFLQLTLSCGPAQVVPPGVNLTKGNLQWHPTQ